MTFSLPKPCQNVKTDTLADKKVSSFKKLKKLLVFYSLICTFATMKTKHIMYETSGTCSKMIDVTADENNVIQQVFFLGGCNGNLQGISQLVRGQKIDDVLPRLNGIRCGTKGTSCPDQLCRALEQLKAAPATEA